MYNPEKKRHGGVNGPPQRNEEVLQAIVTDWSWYVPRKNPVLRFSPHQNMVILTLRPTKTSVLKLSVSPMTFLIHHSSDMLQLQEVHK